MSARNNIYFKSSILDTMVQSRPKDLRYCTSATNFSNFVAAGSPRSTVAYSSANLFIFQQDQDEEKYDNRSLQTCRYKTREL